jgi:hypothetical protein
LGRELKGIQASSLGGTPIGGEQLAKGSVRLISNKVAIIGFKALTAVVMTVTIF